MFHKYWWRLLFSPVAPARKCRAAGASTRPMEVDVLENRLVPAKIFVTGNVTNSSVSADPARFDDGPVTALTPFGKHFLASNLRSAVVGAENIAGAHTILLDSVAAGTYELDSEIAVNFGPATALTIRNRTGGFSEIDAEEESRIFTVNSGGLLTLDHLRLVNGRVTGPFVARGGAIFAGSDSRINLTNDVFTNNGVVGNDSFGGKAYGGAIYMASGTSLTAVNCTFDNNFAQGGKLAASNATAGGAEGGAICTGSNFTGDAATLNIIGSTFSHNRAVGGDWVGTSSSLTYGGFGGYAYGGALEFGRHFGGNAVAKIVNSTFAENSAVGGDSSYGGGGIAYGGAIANRFDDNEIHLVNTTVALNGAYGGDGTIGPDGVGRGGGIANLALSGQIGALNTLIADNEDNAGRDDVFGAFNSQGNNFVATTDGSTGFTATGDLTGTMAVPRDAALHFDGLQNNGGPTQTIALLAFSEAINAANSAVTVAGSDVLTAAGVSALKTDQRGPGFKRKVLGAVDIGAYEFQLNLKKVYSFHSSPSQSTSFSPQPSTPPGLLRGSETVPLPSGFEYRVQLEGSAPSHTQLTVNPDGTFVFTVPPGFDRTVKFRFRLLVAPVGSSSFTATNLIYTAILRVSPGGTFGHA